MPDWRHRRLAGVVRMPASADREVFAPMLWRFKRTLFAGVAAVLLVAGAACGGAEAPAAPADTGSGGAAAPAATEAAAPAATSAPAQPTTPPTATATPPPKATLRPTNTPAPTVVARTAPTPAPSSVAKAGGTTRMSAYADTKDWDPLGSSSLSSVISYSQLYNQIVQFDTEDPSVVVGDLAESWEINDAGTQYTFHLRDGIQWNDGTPLTAADVVYSMQRYGNPCNGRGRSGLWRTYTIPIEVVDITDKADCTATNADEVIRQVDADTVEFNLAFASGAFINFLAIDYAKVLPKHLLEQGIDLNLAENILEHNSGSGPFIPGGVPVRQLLPCEQEPELFQRGDALL